MKNFYLEWRDLIVTMIILCAISFFVKKVFIDEKNDPTLGYNYTKCIQVVLEKGNISDAETMCKHLRIDYEKVYF